MSNRKTVLFVDDDSEFLELLQPYMERLSRGEWEVIVAADSGAAINALASRAVDLAVVDVRMPVVDGVQLLHLLHRKYPQIKKAVLTAYMDASCRSAAFTGGAELVLEKPVDTAGYEALFAALNELVQLQPEQGFRGVLRRVGLEDIIQMECLSRHSLILEVAARAQSGRLYICDGALVHAEFGSATGELALQKLLTLTGGEFHHRPFVDPPYVTLEGSWEFLLMESMRKRDEDADAAASAAGMDAGSAERESAAGRKGDDAEASPVINELVLCSEKGELLYAAQSTQPQDRCEVLMALMGASAKLRSMLPVGALDRVEFVSASGRMIARLHEEHGVFLHANDS